MGCWTPRETFGLAHTGGDATGARGSRQARRRAASRCCCAAEQVAEVELAAARRAQCHECPGGDRRGAARGRAAGARGAGAGAFRGVKRRMEIRGVIGEVTVYDDFAHHPTAIETTLQGLRARVGAARIIAVLEPRSNTMKLGVHREQLAPALELADQSLVLELAGSGLGSAGRGGRLGRSRAALRRASTNWSRGSPPRAAPGDHILVMSNGGFGGLHDKLLAALRARHDAAPNSIALFPLNIVLFPDGPLPLRIFETRYVDMVRRCMREAQTLRRGADPRGQRSGARRDLRCRHAGENRRFSSVVRRLARAVVRRPAALSHPQPQPSSRRPESGRSRLVAAGARDRGAGAARAAGRSC